MLHDSLNLFAVSDEGLYLHVFSALGTNQRVKLKEFLHTGCPGLRWLGFVDIGRWRSLKIII